MARYPHARWRPVSGHTDGPMRSHTGVVLHVNASNGNLYNWVAGNHDMSCHFEVYKNGAIEQYIDTADSAWCQMDGNADYLSIETEGYPNEPLTPAQVRAIAGLIAWLHDVHGIPMQLANHPGERGFGWHGMGGAAWGGHTGCPGDKRKAQREDILARARTAAGVASKPAAPVTPQRPDGYRYAAYTASGDKKGRVYLTAPGVFVHVEHFGLNLAIRLGECSGVVHRVSADTLSHLRRIALGGHK